MRSDLANLDVMLAADCSQMELRALAELSGDELLIKQFQEAALDRKNKLKDIHCVVGHTLTGLPVERIANEKSTRKMVKGVHFGIVFGLSENNLHPTVVAGIRKQDGPDADLTGITKSRLIQLYRTYFQKYRGVKKFQDRMRALAEERGYVETLFGFPREIRADDGRGSYQGNQAVNTPVQGTAHQFLLIALALLDLKPKTYHLLQRCISEVHDSLAFLVKLRDLIEAHTQLMRLFEHETPAYAEREFKLKLKVPLLVEAAAGFCMGSMVEYEGELVEEFLAKWRAKQKEVEAKDWEKEFMPKKRQARPV